MGRGGEEAMRELAAAAGAALAMSSDVKGARTSSGCFVSASAQQQLQPTAQHRALLLLVHSRVCNRPASHRRLDL
jgi:hypothetical protein